MPTFRLSMYYLYVKTLWEYEPFLFNEAPERQRKCVAHEPSFAFSCQHTAVINHAKGLNCLNLICC